MLTPEQLSAINSIESYWIINRIFKAPVDFDIKEALKNPIFVKALSNRGITIPNNSDQYGLSEEQLAAIMAVANFHDTRGFSRKLKDLGITTTKWNGWLRDEQFKDTLHKVTGSQFEDSVHLAQAGLMSAVQRGDVSAIKLFFDATNRYQPQNQSEANIKLLITRIIEAIQVRVRDPQTVTLLARDFNDIFEGRDPNYDQKELSI